MRSSVVPLLICLLAAALVPPAAAAQDGAAPLRGSVVGQPTAPEPEPEEEDDEGRPPTLTFLWLEAGGGLGLANLKKFDFVDQSLYSEQLSGPTFNFGAGLRLFILTLGARVAYSPYKDFNLGAALLEVGLRIPAGIVEPAFRVYGGYAWVGNPNLSDAKGSEINGMAFGGGIAVPIFVTTYLSITPSLDWDVLALGVSGLQEALDPEVMASTEAEARAELERRQAEAEKTHIGMQPRVQLTLGLHL